MNMLPVVYFLYVNLILSVVPNEFTVALAFFHEIDNVLFSTFDQISSTYTLQSFTGENHCFIS